MLPYRDAALLILGDEVNLPEQVVILKLNLKRLFDSEYFPFPGVDLFEVGSVMLFVPKSRTNLRGQLYFQLHSNVYVLRSGIVDGCVTTFHQVCFQHFPGLVEML